MGLCCQRKKGQAPPRSHQLLQCGRRNDRSGAHPSRKLMMFKHQNGLFMTQGVYPSRLDCCFGGDLAVMFKRFLKVVDLQSLTMFKKAIKIGAQNQLSGKDRKNITKKLVAQFDTKSVEAVFAAHDKINCNKVSGSKVLIYMGDEYPLFTDGTGKEDFFPSIYLCTAYEPLLPSIFIKEGVESFIFNGANLMWPGVGNFSLLGAFKKDQVVSIRDCKGMVIAIGAMGCSLDELQKNSDGSGVAVFILHYKGDRLWDMGPKQYPEIIIELEMPKEQEASESDQVEEIKEEGEKQQKKAKQPKQEVKEEKKPYKVEEPKSQEESEEDLDFGAMLHTKKQAPKPQVKPEKKKTAVFSDEEDDRKGKKKGGKKAAKRKDESEEEEIPVKQKHKESQDMFEDEKKPKGKKGKGKKKPQKQQQQQQSEEEEEKPEKKRNNSDDEESEKEEKSAINSQIMDQLFKEAFLNVLKLSKVEVPIDSGRFFSDSMVFAKSDETQLNIKDSSFKKLGRFYEEMAKQKFIEFKPVKEKKGQSGSTISKICWENEQLKSYMPTIRKLGEREVEQKEEVVSKEKLVLSKTVTVEIVYKLSKDLEAIMIPKKKVNYMPDHSEDEEPEQPKKDVYFSDRQIKEKIEKYINEVSHKEKDDKKDKGQKDKERKADKMVTLSYKDSPFIHKILKHQIEEYEQNLAKEEMMMEQDSDEEEAKKKGKKDKHRQNIFRIERGYLSNKIMKLAHPYYQLSDSQTGLNKFREGTFKGIQISTDKIMNKNVTKVIGLESFIPANFKEDQVVKQIHGFAHQLQVKFASSATVQNLPGKGAGREVVVQGNFVEELEGMFTLEYGIKKECITTSNKLGKKKKK